MPRRAMCSRCVLAPLRALVHARHRERALTAAGGRMSRAWTKRAQVAAGPPALGRIVDAVDTSPDKLEAEPDYRISVDVETNYLEEQSDPRERKFVFSYTITLRNV